MALKKVTLHTGQTIEYRDDKEMEGGMKKVYFSSDRSSVVCFFKDKSNSSDPQRQSRLECILGKFNPTTDPQTGEYFKKFYCWPTGMVVKPELGVVCPAYPKEYFFGSGSFKGKEKEGTWFTSPKVRKMIPATERGDWLGYLRICICIARAVRRLHMAGLAHSDLSNKNVLVDPIRGSATVIDIDSLVVPGVFPPDVIGTPGYIAPEVLATQRLPLHDSNRALPSVRTDCHALAVLIYEYLLLRHPLRGLKINSSKSAEEDDWLSMGSKALFVEHPSDASNRTDPKTKQIRNPKVSYASLGTYLTPLVDEAFVKGLHSPNDRPTALKWETALVKTLDLLVPCHGHNCEHKWFVFNGSMSPQCPFCGWKLRDSMPVLNFYKENKPGQFASDNHRLVVWHNQYLFSWHVFDNVFAGEMADRTPLGYFANQNNKWILVNTNCDSLTVVGGGPVPIGQGVELTDGKQVRLSTAPHGRLALVQLVRQ